MDLHIKDILQKVVSNNKLEDPYYSAKIHKYWFEQMSPSITTRTKSLIYRKGILTVFIESAPLKQELFNSRVRIKELLNAHLEINMIKEVIIK